MFTMEPVEGTIPAARKALNDTGGVTAVFFGLSAESDCEDYIALKNGEVGVLNITINAPDDFDHKALMDGIHEAIRKHGAGTYVVLRESESGLGHLKVQG